MNIGPYRAAFVFGYRGHGKRWGRIGFANGFTLRAGPLALHLWKYASRSPSEQEQGL